MKITKDALLKAMKARKHPVFDKGNFNLNLIGVRASDTQANRFNDALCVLFKQAGEWCLMVFDATTDPGTYYRKKPLNVSGTAQVKPGHYPGVWQLGRHQGKYRALVQCNPITVYRDNDKDAELEQTNEETGLFGINLHRANPKTESQIVDRWSAGCQVIANPADFDVLMSLCIRAGHEYGNRFSYTLLDEGDL